MTEAEEGVNLGNLATKSKGEIEKLCDIFSSGKKVHVKWTFKDLLGKKSKCLGLTKALVANWSHD